jgi:hypothetical protein
MYIYLVLLTILSIRVFATPQLRIEKLGNTEPGYLFIAGKESGLGIMDNYSVSLDTVALNKLGKGLDFTVQRNGVMTYWSESSQKYYGLNSSYQIVDSFEVSSPLISDFHELIVASDGSYFLLGILPRAVDMSKLVEGGKSNAFVADFVIEQYSRTKQKLFTWNSKDFIEITQTVAEDELTSSYVRYIHINSIEVDTDGNLLLSCRNLDEILKIRKSDGTVMWRMGGTKSKSNQFTFINDTDNDGFVGFSHQHDVRRLANGNIIVFDNGNLKTTPKSRAVEYKVNESAKTAEKVWEYAPDVNIYAYFMGSVQRLSNGNTLLSFIDRIMEVDKTGLIVYESQFTNFDYVYRVNKHIYKMAGNTRTVTRTGLIDFSTFSNPTYVQVTLNSYNGSGRMMVSRHNYLPPTDFTVANGQPNKLLNYRWTVLSELTSSNSKISIDTRSLTGFVAADSFAIFQRAKESTGEFTKLITTYNATTRRLEAEFNDGGEFIIGVQNLLTNLKPDLHSPRNLQPEKTNAVLKWYLAANATSYEIQVANVSDFSTLIASSSTLTSNTFAINNLENGRSYFWRVRAKDKNAVSQWSDAWTFRTFLKTPSCSLPLNNQKGQLLTKVNLVWTKVPLATSYELQVASEPTFEEPLIYLNNILDSTKDISGLEFRKKYYWRVRALDNEVPTEWSSVFAFLTESRRPIVLSPTNNQNAVSLKVKVDVDLTAETDNYQYQYSLDSLFRNENIYTIPKINFINLNLEEYSTYYLRVRSLVPNDTTRWSDVVRFRTVINKPKLVYPYNYCLLVPMPTYFTLTEVTDATGYELNVKSLDENKKVIRDTFFTVSTNKIEFQGIDKGTTNYWRARTIYKYGKSEWTQFNEFFVSQNGTINSPALLLPSNNESNIAVNGLLKWSPTGNDIQSFRLMVAADNEFNSVLYDVLLKETDFYYKNLEFAKTYYWRVAAYRDSEFSDWSEIRTFTTKEANSFTKPSLIMPKNGSVVQNMKTTLTWERVPSAISYNIEFSDKIDFSNIIKSETNYPTVDLLVDELKSSTDYFWKVQAVGQSNKSEWSEVSKFTTSETLSLQFELEPTDIDFNNIEILDVNGRKIYLYAKAQSISDLETYLESGIYFLVTEKAGSKKIHKFKVVK